MFLLPSQPQRSFDGESRRKRGVSLLGACFRFKGDDPENNTQSNPVNTQMDQRVGASESGVAVGAGGQLDQSFTDQSNTELTVVDQSVHNDLSAEVARSALVSNAAAISSAAGVLEKQLLASQDTAKTTAGLIRDTNDKSLNLVGDVVEKALDKSAEQTAALATEQTEFLKSFYKDRENSDVKIVDGLAKNATAAVIFGLLAWAYSKS